MLLDGIVIDLSLMYMQMQGYSDGYDHHTNDYSPLHLMVHSLEVQPMVTHPEFKPFVFIITCLCVSGPL
jgi:hypothetical protein